jgi:hypothetical protein
MQSIFREQDKNSFAFFLNEDFTSVEIVYLESKRIFTFESTVFLATKGENDVEILIQINWSDELFSIFTFKVRKNEVQLIGKLYSNFNECISDIHIEGQFYCEWFVFELLFETPKLRLNRV